MPELTVAENVALPLILIKTTAREIKQRVGEILTDLNLQQFSRSFPQSLSGGNSSALIAAS